ncbi:MAG: hypothetical protein DI546_01365 [Rhizobium sp.]|nr:MAG: hypothetical protein DI546_01365 [Rhizobium sp.]
MRIERQVNSTVAVIWVSTPNRVLELRELLDEDGLLPADVIEAQACDVGFVDRRTGERVLRVIPAPEAAGTRDWAECRQITDAIEACHRHIDRHARKALFDLQASVALGQRSSPRHRPAA